MSNEPKNELCYFEIPSSDLAKSKEFYSNVFKWEIQENIPEKNYWFFKAGESCGAFSKSDTKHESGINPYINVKDIETSLGSILVAGGKIIKEKTKIDEEHGFFAVFKDTTGNVLSLWSKN